MTGLVEEFAGRLGWDLRPANVVLEGTSDVAILRHADKLYLRRYNASLLGSELGVLPAGRGDEGGADNLSKRLQAVRQVAMADRDKDGLVRFRFIGLFDSDVPGRTALESLAQFDRSVVKYRDVFPLRPIMPMKRSQDQWSLGKSFDKHNAAYEALSWEIEDLLDPDLLSAFRQGHPTAISRQRSAAGRTHSDLTVEGKRGFISFIRENATLDEVTDVIRLIRSLRDYVGLSADHIVC